MIAVFINKISYCCSTGFNKYGMRVTADVVISSAREAGTKFAIVLYVNALMDYTVSVTRVVN